jgi:hypothetical protein
MSTVRHKAEATIFFGWLMHLLDEVIGYGVSSVRLNGSGCEENVWVSSRFVRFG